MSDVVLKLLSHSNHFDFPKTMMISLLEKKGFNIKLVTEVDESEDVYIFFFPPDGTLPKNYICYNLEQLQRGEWDHLIGYLKGAIVVWDYSMKNVRFLQEQHGLQARYLPLGILSSENTVDDPVVEKKRDVLFYGCYSPRRVEYLHNFVEAYADSDKFLFAQWNLWGDDLNREIRDSIVILNVHNGGDHTILESHRLVPLLAKGAFIVSERSSDEHADAIFKEVVNFVDSPEEMYDEAQKIVQLYNEDRSSYEAEVQRRKEVVKNNMNFEQNFYKEMEYMSGVLSNIFIGPAEVKVSAVMRSHRQPTTPTGPPTGSIRTQEGGNGSAMTLTHMGLLITIFLSSVLSMNV
jgi:hypothetical protein